jgi:hypothetical protein
MRFTIAIALASFLAGSSAAAVDGDLVVPPVAFPRLASSASSIEAFVPARWRIETKVSGDLNGDGRADVVLVLREDNPANVIDARRQGGPERYDTNPRMLAVLFANAAPGYDLALENHTLIPRTTEPSQQDPLDPDGIQAGGVEIKHGTMQVTLGYFGGDMGRKTYTFRFQNGGFALIGFDAIDVTRSSGALTQVSVNYSTRRMKRTIGTISSDTDKVIWTTLPRKPLPTIEQVGDGLEFEPQPN